MNKEPRGSMCWTCEKPIKQEVFGPTVQTSSGKASSCGVCMANQEAPFVITHAHIVIKDNEIV